MEMMVGRDRTNCIISAFAAIFTGFQDFQDSKNQWLIRLF
jgi:hypothetical protein